MWLEPSPFAVSPVYCCWDLGCRRHYGPRFGFFYPSVNTPPYIDPNDRSYNPCPEQNHAHRYMALTRHWDGFGWYCFDCRKYFEVEPSFTLPSSA